MTATILVADDDPVQRRLVENIIERCGYEALTVASGDEAIRCLSEPDARRIDAMVLDLVMPGLDGMGVLAAIREAGLAIPVIVQTAHGGIDTVVSAMRAGAQDFVVKPVGFERLQVSLRNALNVHALRDEIRRMKRSSSNALSLAQITTRSERMSAMLRASAKAAASVIPVLIEGESGTGKELLARAIHGSGERAAMPFVAVNCGAIPENLVESILFGHEKGAFTGATDRHSGKFVEASGGTLFLDEIGELPQAAQVKLLRALQEGEVEPVGGRKPVKVDVRVVSATNRSLLDEVKAGRFREDLFYRLHVLPLTVPPLRARREDIPQLARHFLARFAAEENRPVVTLSREVMALLCAQPWPGNVRQLENAIFRAVVMAECDELQLCDFPQLDDNLDVSIVPHLDMPPAPPPVSAAMTPPAWPQPAASGSRPDSPSLHLLGPDSEVRPLEEIETEAIRFAIAHYRGQMSEVARRLQIGRSTLYRKLEALDDGNADDKKEQEASAGH